MCLSPNIAMASGYQYTQLNQGLMAIQTEFCKSATLLITGGSSERLRGDNGQPMLEMLNLDR